MRSIAFPLRGRWLSETKPDEVFCSTSSVTVVSEADFTVTASPQGEAFGRRLALLAGCHSEGASAPVRIRNMKTDCHVDAFASPRNDSVVGGRRNVAPTGMIHYVVRC